MSLKVVSNGYNVSLNGDLFYGANMQPPLRFEHPPRKVCQLRNTLYSRSKLHVHGFSSLTLL